MIKLDNFQVDCYGIKKFKMLTKEKNSEQNADIICMIYGNNDKKYTFHKKNAYNLLVAILGKDKLVTFGITKPVFEYLCNQIGILNFLNKALKGNAFIMLTPHDDYDYYIHKDGMPVANEYITSISHNGEIRAKTLKETFYDNINDNELYKNYQQDKDM